MKRIVLFCGIGAMILNLFVLGCIIYRHYHHRADQPPTVMMEEHWTINGVPQTEPRDYWAIQALRDRWRAEDEAICNGMGEKVVGGYFNHQRARCHGKI